MPSLAHSQARFFVSWFSAACKHAQRAISPACGRHQQQQGPLTHWVKLKLGQCNWGHTKPSAPAQSANDLGHGVNRSRPATSTHGVRPCSPCVAALQFTKQGSASHICNLPYFHTVLKVGIFDPWFCRWGVPAGPMQAPCRPHASQGRTALPKALQLRRS